MECAGGGQGKGQKKNIKIAVVDDATIDDILLLYVERRARQNEKPCSKRFIQYRP